MLLRGHGRVKDEDKHAAKKAISAALNIPRDSDSSSHAATHAKTELHRPYEKSHDGVITMNGCESTKYADYERRMLAGKRSHDQMQEHGAPQLANNKVKTPLEGIQSRLAQPDTSHPVGFAHSQKYSYDRPHSEYSPGSHNSHPATGQHSGLSNGQACVVRPLVSKLDLEAQERRRCRVGRDYNSDDSSDSDDDYIARRDDRVQRLLVVAAVPVAPLDKSRNKLEYLEKFGLTTKGNRTGECIISLLVVRVFSEMFGCFAVFNFLYTLYVAFS